MYDTMNVNMEELYEKHQILSALGGVLLHDLRNPLHSATLLVEAMGLRTSDLNALRGRLRGQLAKLDALISEAAGPMRELALEPRVRPVDATELIADMMTLARTQAENLEQRIQVLGEVRGSKVLADRRIVARAIFEVVNHVGQELAKSVAPTAPVVVRTATEGSTVTVSVEGIDAAFPEAVAKAPFAISGGGVSLALARALVQMSGATLRLQDGSGPQPKFVFGLPLADGEGMKPSPEPGGPDE